jgi:hypothetical protein
VRIGMSWPIGRGRRMWISGGPAMWLVWYVIFCAVAAVWLAVLLVRVIAWCLWEAGKATGRGVRAIYRAIR